MDVLLPTQVEQLHGIFRVFSRSAITPEGAADVIGPTELASVLQALGISSTEAELHELISRADKTGRGWLDVHEFVHLMSGTLKDIDPELEAADAFEWADKDRDGALDVEELVSVLQSGVLPGTQVAADVALTRADLQALIAAAPGRAGSFSSTLGGSSSNGELIGTGSGSSGRDRGSSSAGGSSGSSVGLNKAQFLALLKAQQ